MLIKYVKTTQLPYLTVPVSTFKHMFKNKIWLTENNTPASIMDIINETIDSPMHRRLIKVAKYSYPILIESNLSVLDGAHRLAKCLMRGVENIKVQIIDSVILDKCRIGNGFMSRSFQNMATNLTKKELNNQYHERFYNHKIAGLQRRFGYSEDRVTKHINGGCDCIDRLIT